MSNSIRFILNGTPIELEAEPHYTLLELLRDHVKLTGTKMGCEVGECGACTVLLNGKNVTSCLVMAVTLKEDDEITTIEGLANEDILDPIQEAFIENGALQCGFCTPGMILAIKALLDENPHPSREEIIRGVSGNMCRCTGYEQIIEAVEKAASVRECKEGGRA